MLLKILLKRGLLFTVYPKIDCPYYMESSRNTLELEDHKLMKNNFDESLAENIGDNQ